jgi:hypothetical protein
MTDTEKLAQIRRILQPIIEWYKKIEEDGEPDGSYLYDVTVEKFEELLRRGDYQQIIELLK